MGYKAFSPLPNPLRVQGGRCLVSLIFGPLDELSHFPVGPGRQSAIIWVVDPDYLPVEGLARQGETPPEGRTGPLTPWIGSETVCSHPNLNFSEIPGR